MTIDRPFKRTCRQLVDGSYASSGNGEYVKHVKFAQSPKHYQRAFGVLQKDFIQLLDYIEPASENLECYSYRTHELLMRICIEIEANFKAIFTENGYTPKQPKIHTYQKIEQSHFLSEYRIKLPTWHGEGEIRHPFACWANSDPNERSLRWYSAYNKSKHNRHECFNSANFGAVVDAMCGLFAVLSAQFMGEDFSPTIRIVASNMENDGFEEAIGGYFLVKYPDNLLKDQRYGFNWQGLKLLDDPFQNFSFAKV